MWATINTVLSKYVSLKMYFDEPLQMKGKKPKRGVQLQQELSIFALASLLFEIGISFFYVSFIQLLLCNREKISVISLFLHMYVQIKY